MSTSKPPRWPGHAGFKRFLIAFAVLAVVVIATPLVVLAVLGPSRMRSLMPRYSNTTARIDRVAPLRAWAVTPDPTVSPARAGQALVSLAYRGGRRHPVVLPPSTSFPAFPTFDGSLFVHARTDGWSGPAPDKILGLARGGLPPGERAYLEVLAGNPLWSEFGIVARAPQMDLATAMYVLPFSRSFSSLELPILPFSGTKELAYANASRAAWYLSEKRNAEAERALRETISLGFRLVDDGNSLIEQLIAVVIVGIGRDQLAQFYALTDAAMSARFTAAVNDTASRKSPVLTLDSRDALVSAVADPTLPRGLRLELVSSAALSTCASLREVLFGPASALRDAVAKAREDLVRSPGEGELFDLTARLVTGPIPAPAPAPENRIGRKVLNWSARIASGVLRNPRIVYCASLELQ